MMEPKVVREQGYSFYLVNIVCLPGSVNFNVIMDLDESIEELLPYLAARFPACTYVHGGGAVNLMDSGHIVGIHPGRLTITDVSGMEEAADLCRSYFETILDVKRDRDRITPVYEKRLTLSVLDIVKALPRTNCGACGSPTCMAFAAGVLRRDASIAECGPLMDAPDRHAGLFQKLRVNGYPVP